MKVTSEKLKPGSIVYIQAQWKCRVVEDNGKSITYIPLEGYSEKGRELTAARDLFHIFPGLPESEV